MDGGAWWAAVHGVAKSQIRLSDVTFTFHFSLSCIGEGNGNSLQCSCLENPRDGGAWWAAVYGVAQNQTWLKRLSSNSISLRCTPWWFDLYTSWNDYYNRFSEHPLFHIDTTLCLSCCRTHPYTYCYVFLIIPLDSQLKTHISHWSRT